MDDLLWPHFQPLWRDLVAACSTNILVAGGYGLFLKQRWLSSSASFAHRGADSKLVGYDSTRYERR